MTGTYVTMPSGLKILAPRTPHTWIEKATGVFGDELSAKRLEADVASSVAFLRQRPFFQGEATVTTAVASATYVPIPMAELVDNVAGHSDSTNVSRWYDPFTATSSTIGDWYLVTSYIAFAGGTDPTKSYVAGIRLNGSTVYEGSKNAGATGKVQTGLCVDLVQMINSDYLEAVARQDTGGSINTTITGRTSTLTARWVCARTGTVVALPSTPRTWTAADLLTADTSGGVNVPLNVHIRDTLRFLIYPPIVRLSSVGSSQTIPTGAGTWTSFQLPTATVDNYTGWSSGANTKYTCQRAGLYSVYGLAAVAESATATGFRAARILHTIAAGGTAIYGGHSSQAATASSAGTQLPVLAKIRMAVNDTLELQLTHNEVGALTVKTGSGDHARLIAVWRSL